MDLFFSFLDHAMLDVNTQSCDRFEFSVLSIKPAVRS